MDGIDAAIIETDGDLNLRTGAYSNTPYPRDLRRALLRLTAEVVETSAFEREVTDLHCQAVLTLCGNAGVDLSDIDVIGFHGQTIAHQPEYARTRQLGDGQRMADALGTLVVNRFRQNDLEHGGQGAPMIPAFHRALVLSSKLPQPVGILNIGGVSNVTLVDQELLYACDCGPGNALIDDWVDARCGIPYDDGGELAAKGRIDQTALTSLLDAEYFRRQGPKSLDRNAFSTKVVEALSPQDGAATLAAFTAAAIAAESRKLPVSPNEWIVVGGGRLNRYLLAQLRTRLGAPVRVAEELGWAGSAVEAQGFGYLAVRSLKNLPLSWPSTTGVHAPVTGGVVWGPAKETRPLARSLI